MFLLKSLVTTHCLSSQFYMHKRRPSVPGDIKDGPFFKFLVLLLREFRKDLEGCSRTVLLELERKTQAN